mgnify:CR=1 FL=1
MKYLISILALITVPVQVMAFTTALRRARVLSTRTSTIVSNFIPVRPRILSREKGWLLRMSSGKDSSDTFEKEMRQKQSEANEKVSSASSTSSSFSTNEEHAEHQSAVFDEEASFFASRKNIPDEVVPVLRNMAETVLFGTIAMRDRLTTREKELIPARSERLTHEEGVYHILDVGCGTGALFDYYLEAAAKSQTTVHIHGLDLSPRMVEQARIHGEHLLKDEKLTANRKHSIRVEEGDICEWKPEQQYDLVVANACFGNFYDPPKALEKMADATRPDGWVCITHPLGSDFVRKLHEDNSTVVPHLLPTFSEYRKMARTLPLHVLGVVDKQDESFPLPSFYMASALKTVHRTLPETIRLRGPVAEGYGRGGKKLGFPTANLPVSMFQEALEDLPCGVYFGWAVLEDPEKKKKGRNIPLKAVVNIGFSPTFEG